MNIQLSTSTYSVSTDPDKKKFIISCFVRNMPTLEVIIKIHNHFLNLILECSKCHRLTLILMNFQLPTSRYSVSTNSDRKKFIITCFVRNIPTLEVIIKIHNHFLNLILECSKSHRLSLIWWTFNSLRWDTVFQLILISRSLLSPVLSEICRH